MQNFTSEEFWQAVSSGAAQDDSQFFRAAINPPASCTNWIDPAYLYRYVSDGDIAGCWILHDIEAALNFMSTIGDNPGGAPGESIKFGCTLNSHVWSGFGQNQDQQVAIAQAVKSWKISGTTALLYPRAYSYQAGPTAVAAVAYAPEYYLRDFTLPAGSIVNIEVWCKIIRQGQTFNSFGMSVAENAWCKYHTFENITAAQVAAGTDPNGRFTLGHIAAPTLTADCFDLPNIAGFSTQSQSGYPNKMVKLIVSLS